jgi:hypothetical protein
MKSTVLTSEERNSINVTKLLVFSARLWFAIATLGQWIFGYYIVAFYHVSTFGGDFEKWNKVLPRGYVAGDWSGNLLTGIHVVLASIIVIGGPLQLMPFIRNRFKTFHRWLGRIYVVTVIIVSLAGFILIWTRGTVGSLDMHIFNSIQAVYIITFAIVSIRFAIKRDFVKHQIWTLRLFMVANGVWFFRVGLMAWLLIFRRPVGFNPHTFSGVFLSVLSLFSYAIPFALIVLEMYLLAKKNQNKVFSLITFTVILLSTMYMLIGIVGATIGMWLPKL